MRNFKYWGLLVFWIITSGMLIFLAVIGSWIIPDMADLFSEDPVWFTTTVVAVLLFIGLYVTMGVFIYKDSSRKKMNTWLWLTAVFYIPNFMGVVLYFYARRQKSLAATDVHAQICPHCGHIIHTGE
ncbi:hypothetical protein D3C75_899160 [compost metagenome]|uniref:Phospholipase_D-nuclease N-terminal n=1 Tax=Paenibacillus jilunlii TaxID=682956 RepID=A0A1G9SWW6_9BACL|nr:PLDc N-terminal domain-containing protein [Paenibacillus jilunlii]KWX75074.1 hypothetical protein AML91_13485 [Paenibacillus jilunlii]SDM39931.1 Phospholipase_D-nuclease N-terminal [Paenibacillus jilunlii]